MQRYTGKITKEKLIEFSLEHFATKEYVEKLISENCFSKHGSKLTECTELFEEYEELFPLAYHDKEQTFAMLMHWLPLRIRFIVGDIIDELNHHKSLYRSVYLPAELLANLRNNQRSITVDDIGAFWSTRSDTQAFGAENIAPRDILVKFKIALNRNNIDWYETLVSRIDYIHGEQEQEFRLFKTTTIAIQEITECYERK